MTTLLISFPTKSTAPLVVWRAVQTLAPEARCEWFGQDSPSLTTADASTDTPKLSFRRLSQREHHILHLLASNRPVKAIAESLHLSRHTVNNHARNIYRKLGVGSRAGAVALLLRSEGEAVASVN